MPAVVWQRLNSIAPANQEIADARRRAFLAEYEMSLKSRRPARNLPQKGVEQNWLPGKSLVQGQVTVWACQRNDTFQDGCHEKNLPKSRQLGSIFIENRRAIDLIRCLRRAVAMGIGSDSDQRNRDA